ncbi:MAG: hypothetical protein AAF664_20460 [Planctomycetota bacterium]
MIRKTMLELRNWIILGLTLTPAFALAEDKEKIELLLDRSPNVANTISYANVPAINKLLSDAGLDPTVSSKVREMWFIADMDLQRLTPNWEAGYAVLYEPVTAEELAPAVGGYVDTVNDVAVVHSNNETYFVPGVGEKDQIGILRPANRSLLSKWLFPPTRVNYSTYLDDNAKQSEDYLSFMIAIETTGAFSPVALAKRAANLKSIKAKSPESVGSIMASMRGASVIIGRRSLKECIVRFDFDKSPASLRPIAAEMLGEILENTGAAAPEVLSWKPTVKENQLELQGPITQSTLNGLLSLVSLRSVAEQASASAQLSQRSAADQAAYRTKHYFDQVNGIVEKTRDHRSQTTGALAHWNDRRAREIDELGTLNVDPDMVQYGVNVAELLRGNALAVTQGNIQAGQTKASQSIGGGGYYGSSGYNYNSVTDVQRVTDAYKRGNAYSNYRDALNAIDKLTAETRRVMTDKFQIQF